MITSSDWDNAISYTNYRNMVDALVAEGKTTGIKQSQSLLDYTRLNVQRMHRWDKTAVILSELQEAIKNTPAQKWLVITEGWCGDAAQNVPILAKLSDENPHIEMRIILRDENLPIMDLYLTNGGRSIPKLIALDNDFKEIFNWGPRPAVAQTLVEALKKAETPFEALAEQLHKWYAEDKNAHLQAEFLELLAKNK